MRDNSYDDTPDSDEEQIFIDSLFQANRASRRACARDKHPYRKIQGYCTNCGVHL